MEVATSSETGVCINTAGRAYSCLPNEDIPHVLWTKNGPYYHGNKSPSLDPITMVIRAHHWTLFPTITHNYVHQFLFLNAHFNIILTESCG